jgi:hypothetical protein
VSGQLSVSATYPPGKETSVPTEWEIGWAEERARRCGGESNLLGIEPRFVGRSGLSLVTIPTEKSRLLTSESMAGYLWKLFWILYHQHINMKQLQHTVLSGKKNTSCIDLSYLRTHSLLFSFLWRTFVMCNSRIKGNMRKWMYFEECGLLDCNAL